MTISNTQISPVPAVQPVQHIRAKENEVEDLVNSQKQEYPKPSIPVENKDTKSLTDAQTLVVKASSNQAKIDAYKAGMEQQDDKIEVKTTQDTLKELKTLQDIQNKKEGINAYTMMGMS